MCAYRCAQVSYTTQHTAVLIIFSPDKHHNLDTASLTGQDNFPHKPGLASIQTDNLHSTPHNIVYSLLFCFNIYNTVFTLKARYDLNCVSTI